DIHHRDDDRAALRAIKRIVRHVIFQLGLKAIQINTLEALLNSATQFGAQAVHDLFVVAHVDEAAADDIRAGKQVARLLVDSQHHGHQAFFAEEHAVFHHHIADHSAGLVNQDSTVWYFTQNLHLVGCERHYFTVVYVGSIGAGNALLHRQLDVVALSCVVTVNRNEEFRFGHLYHLGVFVARAVP